MPSRYDPPDPKCRHKRRGVVKSGDFDDGPNAATDVCDRTECIEDAKAWAYAITHMHAYYVPDQPKKPRDPEPYHDELFPGVS